MRGQQINQAAEHLKGLLGANALKRIGEMSGFVIRQRVVTAARFIPSLLEALGSRDVEAIADLVRAFNLDHGTAVAYKPYYNKLDTPCFPRMMRILFELMVEGWAMPALKPAFDSKLTVFRDIIIQDGSSFALCDALADAYKGRFTKVSPAAVELQATMSLFNDTLTRVAVTPDAECERHHLPPAADLVQKLILADRGYDSTSYVAAVAANDGDAIVRIRKCHDPEVVRIYREGRRYSRLEGKRLSTVLKRAPKGKVLDVDVAYDDRPDRRFRVVLAWHGDEKEWMRLLTTLYRNHMTAAEVLRTYRLRWQIELLFKELKSYANLHRFDTTKPYIAEGLIWASLCAAMLKRFIAIACQRAAGVPISTRRVAMVGKAIFAVVRKVATSRSSAFQAELTKLFEYLSRNARRSNPKRERKTGRLAMGLEPANA